MRTISISPITRANTVGSATVQVDGGRVVKAFSEGVVFRGFEIIMEERDPFDAPYLTQRICGICSSVHGMASCRALEAIAGVVPPPNAVITRNLILGLDFLQSHIRHFYALVLWDWVASPPKLSLKEGYGRDLRFSASQTERLWENHWLGVDNARLAHEALTLLGGKAPHNHGLIPGGVSLVPRGDILAELRSRIQTLKSFINNIYLPDAMLLKETYPDYTEIGTGPQSYLCHGLFGKNGVDTDYHFPAGVMLDGKMEELNLSQIKESHAFSWFDGKGNVPFEGKTVPNPSREEAYSWIKAPRYGGDACQGGPLGRQVIMNKKPVGNNSTMERIVARAEEASGIAGLLDDWIKDLAPGEAASVPCNLPSSGSGVGVTDAMRGPLSHWVALKRGRICKYQIITPSAWNFSPKDERGFPGPVEEALLDTPVENPDEPVEIGRIIRSFDPCYACAAHVIDMEKGTKKIIELL